MWEIAKNDTFHENASFFMKMLEMTLFLKSGLAQITCPMSRVAYIFSLKAQFAISIRRVNFVHQGFTCTFSHFLVLWAPKKGTHVVDENAKQWRKKARAFCKKMDSDYEAKIVFFGVTLESFV